MRFSSSGPPLSVKRSEREICGQSCAASQDGNSPPNPPLARIRCFRSPIQATTSGSVTSPVTITLSSPETPVSSWSVSTPASSSTERRDELAEVRDDVGPGARGPAGHGEDEGDDEDAPGRRDRERERPVGERVRASPRPVPPRVEPRGRSGRGPDPLQVRQAPPDPALAVGRPGEQGEAGGQGGGQGEHDADDEQDAEAADHRDRREQQHQEPGRGGERRGGDHRPAARRGDPGAPPAGPHPRRSPRDSAPGTGSRSRPPTRSGPAARRSTPSSASRR